MFMKTIDEKIKNNVSRNLSRKQETAEKPTFFVIASPHFCGSGNLFLQRDCFVAYAPRNDLQVVIAIPQNAGFLVPPKCNCSLFW